jgi:hypothetical protein
VCYIAERTNGLTKRCQYPCNIRVMVLCSENTFWEVGTEWAARSVLTHYPRDLDSGLSNLQALESLKFELRG